MTDDCNRENSCDYDDQSIVHVNITSPEKCGFWEQFGFFEIKNLIFHFFSAHHQDDNEDFLDVNARCDDMDLF